MRHLVVVVNVLAVLAVSRAAADPTLKTDDEKTLYAIGVVLSQSVIPLELTGAERELIKAGFADGVASQALKVDMKDFGPKIGPFTQARSEKLLAAEKPNTLAFLEQQATSAGAQKKPSGLIYTEIKPGDGAQPKPGDMVKVNYTGMLRDGTVFDSSSQRGQPAELAMHGVIPCWAEALQLMKVHGKAKIVCPPELAYGDQGAPPRIKPGAALVFDVELLDVSPGAAAAPPNPGHARPPHPMPEHGMPDAARGADKPASGATGDEP